MNKTFSIAIIFLSIFLILFSFHTINLSSADIGRHIVNGDVLLHSGEYGVSKSDVLHKNFFSYTHPGFSFINHHWLSGVAIYLSYNIFGFGGLSLIYFLLILGTFIFVLATVRDDSDLSSVVLAGIFLIPLIAGRTEVRPEGLSYFLIGLFIFILYQYSKGKIGGRFLWLLPTLMLLWANSHIYFIFGPFLIGMFLLEVLFLREMEKVKKLSVILGASLVAMFITPFGVAGALYPFTIFQNYGYRIVENQSIRFLENLSFVNPEFLWYKITLFLVIVSSIIILVKRREKFSSALSSITLVTALLAYLGIRYIPLFALFSLPLLAYNTTVIKKIFWREIDDDLKMIIYALSFIFIITITMAQFREGLPWNRDFGLGIREEALAPTEFIKNNQIRGPFFNNYDVGGFMIFGLFPKEKVFVDNRPEAYPKDFFEKVYIPMQEDEEVWQREMEKNKFNAIFFYRLDYTPAAQTFLIARVKDPAWVPVFVDNETIIFLYRNKENEEIIKKYELPKEIFKI